MEKKANLEKVGKVVSPWYSKQSPTTLTPSGSRPTCPSSPLPITHVQVGVCLPLRLCHRPTCNATIKCNLLMSHHSRPLFGARGAAVVPKKATRGVGDGHGVVLGFAPRGQHLTVALGSFQLKYFYYFLEIPSHLMFRFLLRYFHFSVRMTAI